MNLERSKQLVMLRVLADVYPRYATRFGSEDLTDDDFTNLWYLREQGLVEGGMSMSLSQAFIFSGAKITAKGLDFLADDGGLSAIFGTLTVRLHADTIKDLLLARVEASDAAPEKKSWLRKQLDVASTETIKKIISAVLDEGVKRAPDLVRLVEQVTLNG